MSDRWSVIVYLRSSLKETFLVGNEKDAMQYASRIQREGALVVDARGVTTFWPVQEIFKVKVVPPGVELVVTEML